MGGTSANTIATYTFKAVAGAATINELSFTVGGSGSSTLAITNIQVGNVSVPVSSGTTTVTGLNIPIPVTNQGTDVTVKVTYNTVGIISGGISPDANVVLTLGTVKYTSGSVANKLLNISIPSKVVIPVAGMPAISLNNTVGTLVSGAINDLATVSVSVTGSSVNLKTIPIKLNFGSTATTSHVSIYDGNTEVGSTTVALNAAVATGTVVFNNGGYSLTGNQTFTLKATVSGVNVDGDSVTTYLGDPSLFTWDDVEGGSTSGTGVYIPSYSTSVGPTLKY